MWEYQPHSGQVPYSVIVGQYKSYHGFVIVVAVVCLLVCVCECVYILLFCLGVRIFLRKKT